MAPEVWSLWMVNLFLQSFGNTDPGPQRSWMDTDPQHCMVGNVTRNGECAKGLQRAIVYKMKKMLTLHCRRGHKWRHSVDDALVYLFDAHRFEFISTNASVSALNLTENR